MKKKFFIIVDTETTQNQKVADFGAVIVDKLGVVHSRCGVLVAGIYDEKAKNPLFFDRKAKKEALWSRHSADLRYVKYDTMLEMYGIDPADRKDRTDCSIRTQI
jgi:hypothetical protein